MFTNVQTLQTMQLLWSTHKWFRLLHITTDTIHASNRLVLFYFMQNAPYKRPNSTLKQYQGGGTQGIWIFTTELIILKTKRHFFILHWYYLKADKCEDIRLYAYLAGRLLAFICHFSDGWRCSHV